MEIKSTEHFAEIWLTCWNNYFKFNRKILNKQIEPKYFSKQKNAKPKYPCLTLASKVEKNINIENPIPCTRNKSYKALFIIDLNNKSRANDYRLKYSKLRKRDLKYSLTRYIYEHKKIKDAISLLKSDCYENMHHYFYKSFPSPELPIGLLIHLVRHKLIKMTAYYCKSNGKLVGAAFYIRLKNEYYIPFIIYNRERNSCKGLSTYIWSMQFENCMQSKISLINLGTSNYCSNVANFKQSMGAIPFFIKKKRSNILLQNLHMSKILSANYIKILFDLLPKPALKILGYYAYKYLGEAI